MIKKQQSSLSSLFSTVKKPKHNNLLSHAKSYDEIFCTNQLEPSEVKVLLNNNKSLKNIKIFSHAQRITDHQASLHKMQSQTHRDYNICNSHRQSKQTLSQILQESVKKQNILIKRQLFDPYKYFGSSTQVSNIQQSTRHHQSRLQAMFSESNSPLHTDHSASYRKKSSIQQNKKINVDVHRISSSMLIAKLQKLESHEKQLKQSMMDKNTFQKKHSIKNLKQKQNIVSNSSDTFKDDSNLKIGYGQKPQMLQSNHRVKLMNSSKCFQQKQKMRQTDQQSLMVSSKKTSFNTNINRIESFRQVNCSPKSYVKDCKQNYLKMNLNNLQKVRLKLKLTSSKN